MSEAIIARGSSSSKTPSISVEDTFIITNNVYSPPVTGNYYVVCVGGGQAGFGAYYSDYTKSDNSNEVLNWYANAARGGNSGYCNYGSFYLNAGDFIEVTIGSGGERISYIDHRGGNSGGTTSFGTYLAANGGGYGGGYNLGTYGQDIWFNGYSWNQLYEINRYNGGNLYGKLNGGAGGHLFIDYVNIYNNNSNTNNRLSYGEGGIGGGTGTLTTSQYEGNYIISRYSGGSDPAAGNSGICIIHYLG